MTRGNYPFCLICSWYHVLYATNPEGGRHDSPVVRHYTRDGRASEATKQSGIEVCNHVALLAMSPPRKSGWDPILLVSQVNALSHLPSFWLTYVKIVSVQTIHYLTLSVLIPPLLSLFAEPNSLGYEWGAANVGTPRPSHFHRWVLILRVCILQGWSWIGGRWPGDQPSRVGTAKIGWMHTVAHGVAAVSLTLRGLTTCSGPESIQPVGG